MTLVVLVVYELVYNVSVVDVWWLKLVIFGTVVVGKICAVELGGDLVKVKTFELTVNSDKIGADVDSISAFITSKLFITTVESVVSVKILSIEIDAVVDATGVEVVICGAFVVVLVNSSKVIVVS